MPPTAAPPRVPNPLPLVNTAPPTAPAPAPMAVLRSRLDQLEQALRDNAKVIANTAAAIRFVELLFIINFSIRTVIIGYYYSPELLVSLVQE